MPIAETALYVLCLMSAAVGMCLGVLLPVPFPGVNFGVSLALLIGFFSDRVLKDNNMGYTLTGLALFGAMVSTKYVLIDAIDFYET